MLTHKKCFGIISLGTSRKKVFYMNQLKRKRRSGIRIDRILLLVILFAAVGMLIFLVTKKLGMDNGNNKTPTVDVLPSDTQKSDATDATPSEEALMELAVQAVEGTRPTDFGMTWELEKDGEVITSYSASEPFFFGMGDDYTDVEGVISFRGNSFRDGGSYGNIDPLNILYDTSGKPVWGNILESVWSTPTYSMPKGNGGSYSGSWTGSGWTGQPITTRQNQTMNWWK